MSSNDVSYFNTATAAEAMAICARELQSPDYKALAKMISKEIEENREMPAEAIANAVIRQVRG